MAAQLGGAERLGVEPRGRPAERGHAADARTSRPSSAAAPAGHRAAVARYGARNAVSAASSCLGSLLGDPVAGAGEDHGLHVVGDELHRVPGTFTGALLAADRQDGHGQPPGLALLVLRDDRGERAVELEAAAQRVGVGGEGVDVVLDGVVGQLARPGRGVELRAEEDVLPPPDERLVHLRGELVEGEVPEPGVERRGEEQRR